MFLNWNPTRIQSQPQNETETEAEIETETEAEKIQKQVRYQCPYSTYNLNIPVSEL